MQKSISTIVLSLLLSIGLEAQNYDGGSNQVIDEMLYVDIEGRLQIFIDDINHLHSDIAYDPLDSLASLQRQLNYLDGLWDTYYSVQQVDIASDEKLMGMTAQYLSVRQLVGDALSKQLDKKTKIEGFVKAERFIMQQDTIYSRFLSRSETLALTSKTAPLLEKLKAEEQLVFTDLQKHYDMARAAVEEEPALKARMQRLEDRFIDLKSKSKQIQETVYKPFIQRIKDWLLGLAAVAILLMFGSMLSARIQAVKQARAQAQKLKQMMRDNDSEYPTI